MRKLLALKASGYQRHPVVAMRDVADIYRFCEDAVSDYFRTTGGFLVGDRREELVQELVVHACALEKRFDPAKCSSFSRFLFQRLRWKVTDKLRCELGDRRYGLDRQTESLSDEDREQAARAIDLDVAEVLEMMHLERLSPASRETVEFVMLPMLEQGKNQAEVAKELGRPPRFVSSALRQLRRELEEKGCLANAA